MIDIDAILLVATFGFGTLIGSFFNVVILRLPEGKGVVWERSSCTNCSTQLAWFENIPLVSYLFLRGKCRTCRHHISLQYPLIEIVYGVVAMITLNQIWNVPTLNQVLILNNFLIVSILVSHFVIDLRHQLLLDKLNIALLVPVLINVAINSTWADSIAGGVVGFGFPLIVTWIFYKLRGQIGLGGGDIKLFGVLGLLFGISGVMLNLFLSCMLGSVVTVMLMVFKVVKRDQYIPFGPYIITVAIAQILIPNQMQAVKLLLVPYY